MNQTGVWETVLRRREIEKWMGKVNVKKSIKRLGGSGHLDGGQATIEWTNQGCDKIPITYNQISERMEKR